MFFDRWKKKKVIETSEIRTALVWVAVWILMFLLGIFFFPPVKKRRIKPNYRHEACMRELVLGACVLRHLNFSEPAGFQCTPVTFRTPGGDQVDHSSLPKRYFNLLPVSK
jgi:hypothetical protein